jgi:raffinose/stachyose/melibiose transport system permease protein
MMTAERRTAILFLVPALLLFGGFVIWPMIQAIWFSLYEWNGFGAPQNFVGLANYTEALSTPAFRRALFDVAILIGAALLIQLPMGLACALLVAGGGKATVGYRLILFLPYVLAQTATGIVFTFLYDGRYGLAAQITTWLGTEPFFALASETWSLPAIVSVMVWKYFGFGMMIFVAGLQSLDPSLTEAARIDGANRRQILRHVVLPHLKGVAILVAFFGVLGAVQLFDLIMALTGGGPNDKTQTMVTYLYGHGLARLRIGYGSAIGVILFASCVAIALLFRRKKADA